MTTSPPDFPSSPGPSSALSGVDRSHSRHALLPPSPASLHLLVDDDVMVTDETVAEADGFTTVIGRKRQRNRVVAALPSALPSPVTVAMLLVLRLQTPSIFFYIERRGNSSVRHW